MPRPQLLNGRFVRPYVPAKPRISDEERRRIEHEKIQKFINRPERLSKYRRPNSWVHLGEGLYTLDGGRSSFFISDEATPLDWLLAWEKVEERLKLYGGIPE